MIRERLDELDHLLDHLDGGRVFVGVAKAELLRQDFRAGLGDGTQLEEVDEVDVAEPVRALVFSQVRVEPGTGEKGAKCTRDRYLNSLFQKPSRAKRLGTMTKCLRGYVFPIAVAKILL